jgi:hypothetical protein
VKNGYFERFLVTIDPMSALLLLAGLSTLLRMGRV